MGVGVRCFQCKEEVKGWNTGQKHGKRTGHTWLPGYYCTECKQTFQTHQLCQNHTEKVHEKNKNVPTVPPPLSAPAPSSSSASDRRPLILSRPAPSAIGVPRPDMSSLSGSGSLAGANLKAENGPPSSFQCTICELPGTFSSKESLEQHLARTSTCTKCSTHFYEPGKLQEHYRTASAHPRCRECGDGFPGLNEWATHRARCPPPAAESAQNTSTGAPPSISDGFSFVSVSAGGSDVVSHDGGTLEPSELSSVAPSSPLLHPIVAGRDIDTVDDDMSDRISVSRDTARTPISVTENFKAPNTRALQDSPEPPKADKGKSRALSSNGAATPTTATTTLEGSQRIRTRTPTAKPLSFHCRSCVADPCLKPVATLCGHIFCHSCIVRELATKMACPVCQRPFLVRLHVGMGGS